MCVDSQLTHWEGSAHEHCRCEYVAVAYVMYNSSTGRKMSANQSRKNGHVHNQIIWKIECIFVHWSHFSLLYMISIQILWLNNGVFLQYSWIWVIYFQIFQFALHFLPFTLALAIFTVTEPLTTSTRNRLTIQ